MAASRQITELRNLLSERFGQQLPLTPGKIATHIPMLEEVGGLAKGAITEIICPQRSAGSAFLIHSLLRVARQQRFCLALIDGQDSFDLQTVSAETLQHLLWLRCQTAGEAIKAADLLLRDGNFPLVILDLILNPPAELRRIPASNWYRLQRLVESAATGLVVMSRHNLVPSARTKLVLQNQWRLGDLQRDDALPYLQLRIATPLIPSEAEASQ